MNSVQISTCLFLNLFIATSLCASAGTLDTTFNSSGVQPGTNATNIDASINDAQNFGIAIQTDGNIVVVGNVTEGLTKFAVARFTPSGVLDTTFNSGGGIPGTASTAINSNANDSRATGVALQSDGKILLCGTVTEGSADKFAVARFNSDGSLDTTFNSGGGIPGTVSTFIDDVKNTVSGGFGVAVQPDGKIVVAGFVNENFMTIPTARVAIARFNADGTLDTTFNSGGTKQGTVSYSIDADGNPAFGGTPLIQPDGKIIIDASVTEVGIDKFAALRLNSNGSLDTTFNAGGTKPGTVSTFVNAAGNSSLDNSYKIALQPDGKLVITGWVIEGGVQNLAVVRFNGDGTLDSTFNPGGGIPGTVSVAIDSSAFGSGVAIQTNGMIVISGSSRENLDEGFIPYFLVVRFTSTGALDTTFNSTGIVRLATVDNDIPANGGETITNVSLQSDGKIVIGGSAQELGVGGTQEFGIARFIGEAASPTTSNACALRLINKYGPRLL